jgi:hypothetical protein
VCKRFGRELLGAILRLVGGEVSSPTMEKTVGEEHSVASLCVALLSVPSSKLSLRTLHHLVFVLPPL